MASVSRWWSETRTRNKALSIPESPTGVLPPVPLSSLLFALDTSADRPFRLQLDLRSPICPRVSVLWLLERDSQIDCKTFIGHSRWIGNLMHANIARFASSSPVCGVLGEQWPHMAAKGPRQWINSRENDRRSGYCTRCLDFWLKKMTGPENS